PAQKLFSAKFLEQGPKLIFKIQESPLGGPDERCACSAIGLPGPSPPAYLPQSPMCLRPSGDACVVGALERVGDTLYGARVYVKLGRRLAHAHAAPRAVLIRSASLSAIGGRPSRLPSRLARCKPARTRS